MMKPIEIMSMSTVTMMKGMAAVRLVRGAKSLNGGLSK
jgi:hypothetical protein